MPMSGGLPAARRVRISGMKSRADVYCTLIPVAFVKAAVTFRNASFSLPPHSESTSIEFALRFAVFALIAVAVIAATTSASRTVNAMNGLRRFTPSSSLAAAGWLPPFHDPTSPLLSPRVARIVPSERGSLSSPRGERLLRLRIEDVELLRGDRERHLVARLHFLVGGDESYDL